MTAVPFAPVDTNTAQFQVCQQLAPAHGNLARPRRHFFGVMRFIVQLAPLELGSSLIISHTDFYTFLPIPNEVCIQVRTFLGSRHCKAWK